MPITVSLNKIQTKPLAQKCLHTANAGQHVVQGSKVSASTVWPSYIKDHCLHKTDWFLCIQQGYRSRQSNILVPYSTQAITLYVRDPGDVKMIDSDGFRFVCNAVDINHYRSKYTGYHSKIDFCIHMVNFLQIDYNIRVIYGVSFVPLKSGLYSKKVIAYIKLYYIFHIGQVLYLPHDSQV